jgi:hypothetical protein
MVQVPQAARPIQQASSVRRPLRQAVRQRIANPPPPVRIREGPFPAFPTAFLICDTRFEEKSGIRESNPSSSLGKAVHSRYANPAFVCLS